MPLPPRTGESPAFSRASRSSAPIALIGRQISASFKADMKIELRAKRNYKAKVKDNLLCMSSPPLKTSLCSVSIGIWFFKRIPNEISYKQLLVLTQLPDKGPGKGDEDEASGSGVCTDKCGKANTHSTDLLQWWPVLLI